MVVKLNRRGEFDLSSIPNFDVTRISYLENATINGSIVSIIDPHENISYSYNINAKEQHHFELEPEKIKLTFENFPDANLLFVLNSLYGVKDDYIDFIELYNTTDLNLADKQIDSLKGLELFENLERLNVSHNNLSSIDLSPFPLLEKLNISNNKLTELKLDTLTNLQELDCSNNTISSLDIGDNKALAKLNCKKNAIKKLDIKNNTNLKDYTGDKSVITIASIKKASFKSKKAKGQRVTLKWSKKPDYYYTVEYSLKKTKGYKAVIKKKAVAKCTTKKLAQRKTYYFRIKAIKIYNGVQVASQYSKPVKVKI